MNLKNMEDAVLRVLNRHKDDRVLVQDDLDDLGGLLASIARGIRDEAKGSTAQGENAKIARQAHDLRGLVDRTNAELAIRKTEIAELQHMLDEKDRRVKQLSSVIMLVHDQLRIMDSEMKELADEIPNP